MPIEPTVSPSDDYDAFVCNKGTNENKAFMCTVMCSLSIGVLKKKQKNKMEKIALVDSLCRDGAEMP